ncbi:peptidase S8/S53 domain-containing protein [Cladochytrium replicatum]|nr:peptidase S8/S53 domain-containing protein [Cladochytrium replicatum]
MLVVVSLAAGLVASSSLASAASLAPFLHGGDQGANYLPINGSYIVAFKPHSDLSGVAAASYGSQLSSHITWLKNTLANANSLLPCNGPSCNRISHVYGLTDSESRFAHAKTSHVESFKFKGYSGRFDDAMLASIRKRPEVAYVELDQTMRTATPLPAAASARVLTEPRVTGAKLAGKSATQENAPWGISRISQRERLSGDTYTYKYSSYAGAGVTAYVIDTGVYVEHEEFEGRARWGASIPAEDPTLVDGNGHGTHCAGTIGGASYGVAKAVEIVGVKVLTSQGYGSLSDVIKGIEFAVTDHTSRVAAAKGKKIRSVANMSLGGGRSVAMDEASNAAVDAGVHLAVAAGNDNWNACYSSPASAAKPITVGATNVNDGMAWFSNYGSCVNIFAPGVDILSTWIGGPTSVAYLSGTSMATPHVCGSLALYLSRPKYSSYADSPQALQAHIVEDIAEKDSITGIPQWYGGDNRFLHTSPPADGESEEEDDDDVAFVERVEAAGEAVVVAGAKGQWTFRSPKAVKSGKVKA